MFAMKLCPSNIREAIPRKSYQHGCLNKDDNNRHVNRERRNLIGPKH